MPPGSGQGWARLLGRIGYIYIFEEGRDRQLELPAWVFEGVLREHGMEYLSCLMEF